MRRTIELEIDDHGRICALDPDLKVPPGRAWLVWPVPEAALGVVLSEESLAENWLSPEEDAAWAHLQPVGVANEG